MATRRRSKAPTTLRRLTDLGPDDATVAEHVRGILSPRSFEDVYSRRIESLRDQLRARKAEVAEVLSPGVWIWEGVCEKRLCGNWPRDDGSGRAGVKSCPECL